MCLALPGKIISIDGPYAQVDFSGVIQKINIQLIENAEVGIYVLVHAGFAIEKINTDSYAFLDEMILELINSGDKYE